jgi:enoyl-CoA hydratase/carnithine racemase
MVRSSGTGGGNLMALIIENNGRIRTLTLDRQQALNAFDDEMYKAVGDALREVSPKI